METPKCLLIDEWIKKIWYICTREYYSAIRKNQIMPFAAAWMERLSCLFVLKQIFSSHFPFITKFLRFVCLPNLQIFTLYSFRLHLIFTHQNNVATFIKIPRPKSNEWFSSYILISEQYSIKDNIFSQDVLFVFW